ncbi:class C sortase [Microbacterium paludicola]|uniref:Class C sortase n=1 Tax=Microbacterium paludicola TaxID=300019 RepID=A0A4Y9FVY6_9MICO|nr:class C sortase [Microbacterium paludicola]MBF0816881.1 class C sortase [Microbacterium paludicola]TFU32402.1 class C sortase [Microbacterium paludicola]
MTQVVASPAANAVKVRHVTQDGTAAETKAWRRQQAALATIALAGIGLLLYPGAAAWFSDVTAHGQVTAQSARIAELDPDATAAALEAAEEYNATSARGLIIDPFSNTPGAGDVPLDDAATDYLGQLSLDPAGIISRITIPAIDADLPVYHGSTDETLKRGIGHLYGSSLPVGGPGTHAILTGHSGLPEARFFTDLASLRPGDLIRVTTLGRDLYYEVTGSDTVDPTDIANLHIVPGQDLLTLVTCTPIGINTHRLTVHATRVDPPADEVRALEQTGTPFPWWMIGAGAALTGWTLALILIHRHRPNNTATTCPAIHDRRNHLR